MTLEQPAKSRFHGEHNSQYIQQVTDLPSDFAEDFTDKVPAILPGKSSGPLVGGAVKVMFVCLDSEW